MNATSRRHRSSASERVHWVQRYWQSGLSQREFAMQHGLGLSTLQRWVARHPASISEAAPGSSAAGFAELKVSPLPPALSWAAEVIRPDGWTVRFASGAPEAFVQQLLRAC